MYLEHNSLNKYFCKKPNIPECKRIPGPFSYSLHFHNDCKCPSLAWKKNVSSNDAVSNCDFDYTCDVDGRRRKYES